MNPSCNRLSLRQVTRRVTQLCDQALAPLNLPPDENGVARQYFGAAGHRIGEGDPELLPPLAGCGFENYRNIFTRREGGERQAR